MRTDSLIIAVDDDGRPYRARYWWSATRRLEGPARADRGDRASRRGSSTSRRRSRPLEGRGDRRGLALDGCVDIDIYPSPFTNTLPMRRLTDAVVGRPVAMDVAWVVLPGLTIQAARQEYTLLERADAGARWRFRGLDSDFVAEIDVDRNGVVLDYPGIARRVL